jgi:mono/diheme cytochrome c family protein
MKMKTQTLAKTTIVAALITGALCWSAAADDATTQLWGMNCAACHGKDGTGQTMMGRRLQMKDLTDPKVQASFTDAKAMKIIKEGVTDNGTEKMKAFGDKFSDDQIKALLAQVRSFKPAK